MRVLWLLLIAIAREVSGWRFCRERHSVTRIRCALGPIYYNVFPKQYKKPFLQIHLQIQLPDSCKKQYTAIPLITVNLQSCIPAIFLLKLLTFQIIASAFRPHMDFTTSRLADIPFARRKKAAGRAGAAEYLRGGEEKEPAAVGGGSRAPVPRLSVPQRVSLSQLRAQLSGLPVPDSTFPAFPRSRGSSGAARSRRGQQQHTHRSPWFLRAFVPVHSSPARGLQCPPSERLRGCYSLSNSLKIHLCLRKTAEAKLLSRPCSPKARNVQRQVLQNMMAKKPLLYAYIYINGKNPEIWICVLA